MGARDPGEHHHQLSVARGYTSRVHGSVPAVLHVPAVLTSVTSVPSAIATVNATIAFFAAITTIATIAAILTATAAAAPCLPIPGRACP